MPLWDEGIIQTGKLYRINKQASSTNKEKPHRFKETYKKKKKEIYKIY